MSARPINDGGPAFPVECVWRDGEPVMGAQTDNSAGFAMGVSVRDYFAAKAMNGILSDPLIRDVPEDIAVVAYQLADAMLAERAKAGAK